MAERRDRLDFEMAIASLISELQTLQQLGEHHGPPPPYYEAAYVDAALMVMSATETICRAYGVDQRETLETILQVLDGGM